MLIEQGRGLSHVFVGGDGCGMSRWSEECGAWGVSTSETKSDTEPLITPNSLTESPPPYPSNGDFQSPSMEVFIRMAKIRDSRLLSQRSAYFGGLHMS